MKNNTESSSVCANNQFFLNMFIKCWAGFIETNSTFDEQIQEKVDH
jgi:hypothetical protein